MPEIAAGLTEDHSRIEDLRQSRRYLAKFEKITGHFGRVAALLAAEGRLSKPEIAAAVKYITGLTLTFRALGHKYRFAGRWTHGTALTFDRHESGFPVHAEVMEMALDAQQATRHLQALGSVSALKAEMVRAILADLAPPTRLQNALSQRLYYEELQKGGLFWARNDPEITWLSDDPARKRRRYLLTWAVYDSTVNLPVVYFLDLEDAGRSPLPTDPRRWPAVQYHLMAQSVAALKLVTIATGFDADFEDLHPKRLRRIHLGPMYSAAFTVQSGPIHAVLTQANAPEGEDWALVWTVEDLVAERVDQVKTGWFSQEERQIFKLDPFSPDGSDHGVSRMERFVLLPERPFQALAELQPPGFAGVEKFVVGTGGRVLRYR